MSRTTSNCSKSGYVRPYPEFSRLDLEGSVTDSTVEVLLEQTIDRELSAVHLQLEQVSNIVLDAVTKLGEGFAKFSGESQTQQDRTGHW